MPMKLKFAIYCWFVFGVCAFGYGQKSESFKGVQVLKLIVLPANGIYAGAAFEYFATDRSSVQVGIDALWGNENTSNLQVGGFTAQYRFHLFPSGDTSGVMARPYAYAFGEFNSGTFEKLEGFAKGERTEYYPGLGLGAQLFLKKRISFDLNAGLGYGLRREVVTCAEENCPYDQEFLSTLGGDEWKFLPRFDLFIGYRF